MEILELDRIISLLRDESYALELGAFRRSVQRLKIRLRNNKLTAQLKHLKTLIHRMEVAFPLKLFERLKTTKLTKKSTVRFLFYISQFIKRISEILQKTITVYGCSQAHFKVGHLLQHYLVIRASLARLTYCFKALLVYSADLYHDLSRTNNIERMNESPRLEDKLLTYEEVKTIVLKHECCVKQEAAIDTPAVFEGPKSEAESKEQVGQLIDRKTMRPMRTCKRVQAQ